jgi:hypothetical protein
MKLKLILATLAALASATAVQAATAQWTGRMEYVQTVTYKRGISCEYVIYGQYFWRTFTGTINCPTRVEVQ